MEEKEYSEFDWRVFSVVASLPKGNDAEKLFKNYQEEVKKFPACAPLNFLKYDYNLKEINNSNVFLGGLVNKLISKSGLRVAVPRDDKNGDISRLTEGKYYTDFNTLVLREKSPPEGSDNKKLWIKIIETLEKRKLKIKFPFMIQGFGISPNKDQTGYGIDIIPLENFEAIHDPRLSKKYDRWRFNKIDKDGLPGDLSKNKEGRILYTNEDGLTRLTLGRFKGLFAGYEYISMTHSSKDGRIILIKEE